MKTVISRESFILQLTFYCTLEHFDKLRHSSYGVILVSMQTVTSSGFPLTCPDKIAWLSLTFLGEFSLTFPDLCIVVYIQMKQFEDNVSSSTSTKTFWLMLKIRSKHGGKLNIGYIWKCAERSEAENFSAVDTFSLIRKVWKLYNVWPGSEQNSLTFPDHSQGIKNNSLIFPKS